jgi:Fur family ferric uptake transcriptional regulator
MEEKIFIDFIQSKKLKYTKERSAILKEVFSHHNHFDPKDLLTIMRKKSIRVSRASMYRTLSLLIECGLAAKAEKTEKHTHYEHTFGHKHHDHMICIKCGKITSLSSEKLEQLQKKLCKEKKFKPITHSLEIKGYCSGCE